jgi:hypothetical protein
VRDLAWVIADDLSFAQARLLIMNPFIRAVEIWTPGTDRTLEFGGGLYEGELEEFREISELALFAYDEGLPGKAWAAKHPIILTDFADSYFRRADEARMFGLKCAVAIPIFSGDILKAVLGLLCGRDAEDDVGAIELWNNEADLAHELSLVEGYYGAAESFGFNSRQMKFPRGYGLPGRAWKANNPVIISGLADSRQFLRAKEVKGSGMRFGLAIPYKSSETSTWVMTFLSNSDTPIARRLEIWKPRADADALIFETGYCTSGRDLNETLLKHPLRTEEGPIGRAWATGMPVIEGDLVQDGCPATAAAVKAGLKQAVALPVFQGTDVSSVIAWYF